MAKVIIEGVYAVTPDNLENFYNLWESEKADPNLVAQFMDDESSKMTRIDHPDKPYYPDIHGKPDEELWMWQHPKYPKDPKKMMSLKMDVKKNGTDGGYTETPVQWISGQTLTAVVIYKKSCCPQYSVMLCAVSGGEFKYVIRDDIGTRKGQQNLFDGKMIHDAKGEVISHDLGHILKRDGQCDHGHGHDGSHGHTHAAPAKGPAGLLRRLGLRQ
jgi:hypothetical protein